MTGHDPEQWAGKAIIAFDKRFIANHGIIA